MKQPDFILRNENGSTLIVALMVLVLLTLIGIAATNTSITEIQIAGNEKAYKQAFYNADAGVSWVVATGPSVSGLVPPADIAQQDLDGDGVNDFGVSLLCILATAPGDPTEIEIQSDSSGGRGNASIIAGVRYAPVGGALEGPGDEGVN